jgi:hypothetical protein
MKLFGSYIKNMATACRIKISWATMNAPQTRHDDYLGVRSLAAITIAICLLSGVACLLADRVRIEIGVWCHAVAVCGTLGCLFLAGMVAVAFFRESRP